MFWLQYILDWLYPTHQFNSSHDKNTRSDIIHEDALFDELKINDTVSEHEACCTRVLLIKEH